MKHFRHAFLASISLLLLATPVLAQNLDGLWIVVAPFFCCIGGTLLSIVCLFLLSMQKALNRVSPHNRLMSPRMVWLNLIPGVNFVWQFVTVIRVTGSLKNEFRDRGHDNGTGYGKRFGIAYCISASLHVVIGLLDTATGFVQSVSVQGRPDQAPGVALVAIRVFALILLIVIPVSGVLFWVKIAWYSRQLAYDKATRLSRLRAFDKDDGNAEPGAKAKPSEGIQEGDGF